MIRQSGRTSTKTVFCGRYNERLDRVVELAIRLHFAGGIMKD